MRTLNGFLTISSFFILFCFLYPLKDRIIYANTNNNSSLSSMDTSAYRYFPLKVGNKFFYDSLVTGVHRGKVVSTVSSSSVMDGKTWYLFDHGPLDGKWYRYDSLSGNIFQYSPTFTCSFYYHQFQFDSLWANINDRETGCNYSFDYPYVEDTSTITFFGNYNTFTKTYNHNSFDINLHYRYAKNIGLVYALSGYSIEYEINGCIINNIAYGDTTLISVKNISTETPKEFSLLQNYPNPFNPETKIKFSVPLNKGGNRGLSIQLKIYDILGKEVAILVNQQLQPATYEVEWNATNYPSGIYFYKLTAGDFVQTKKMILLK